jgi:hypothetical protein
VRLRDGSRINAEDGQCHAEHQSRETGHADEHCRACFAGQSFRVSKVSKETASRDEARPREQALRHPAGSANLYFVESIMTNRKPVTTKKQDKRTTRLSLGGPFEMR